jgi:hypothetical protein
MDILSTVAQLVQLGLVIEPEVQAAVQQVMLLSGGPPPTADQQATIDAALESAHAALQAAK